MKKLFVFFVLCAGIFFASCFGGGTGLVLSAQAYEYHLLDNGTVFVDVNLCQAPKIFTIPAEEEGSKVSKVEIEYRADYRVTPLPDVDTITVSEGEA